MPTNKDRWGSLNSAAQQELAAVGKRRSDRIWSVVLFIATLVLVSSAAGLVNRALSRQAAAANTRQTEAVVILPVSGGPTEMGQAAPVAPGAQTEEVAPPETSAVAAADPAAVSDATAGGGLGGDAGGGGGAGVAFGALPAAAPAEVLYFPLAMMPLGEKAAALEASHKAATQISICLDSSQQSLAVVSGPIFEPAPGHQWVRGSSAPVIQAIWVIENRSSCEWKQVAVLSSANREMLTPTVKKGDAVLRLETYSNDSIKPGEQATIEVGFRPEQAGDVRRDWVLVVNGLFLFEQPHLVMEVFRWVQIVEPTATVRVVDTPVYDVPAWPVYPTQAPVAVPTEGPPASRP